jgi:hypothetical protein
VRIAGGIAAALCGSALLSAKNAVANGRYPAATQVVLFSPDASDPDLVVVRTTYGLLVSRDHGTSWRWVCESALGVPSVSIEDPSVVLTANDALVVGLAEGLEVSADSPDAGSALGCSFACVAGPLAGQSVADLATAPPHTVLALTSTYVFDDAGMASRDTRIWESDDDVARWTVRGGAFDPTVSVTTLDVAPGDPERLYLSGTRGFGAVRTASLFVSTDGGETWTERPMPFDPTTEVSVFIGAVDPSNADRIYVRSSGASRLYVTVDAGRSFQVPLALTGQMLGFAIAADGSMVYAGSIEDGLVVAARDGGDDAERGLAFHKASSIPVRCLATHGSELWACSDPSSGFSVGVSIDEGGHFAARVPLSNLPRPVTCASNPQGPFACGASANASQCSGETFQAECATLGGCGEDAATSDRSGAPDLTADASEQAARAPSTSCGCSLVRGEGPTDVGAACAAAAIVMCWRRRRSD